MSNTNLINGVDEQLTDWSQVNWKKARKIVRNLRQRIFRARQLGQWKQLRRLQKLLIKSRANLVLSVRQITQVNTGKQTAGIDKEVINTPAQRVKLVNNWEMPKAKPTKRVHIPKPNGKKRPLGIPTVRDRVAQAIVKNALEPEWESQFEVNSYGFRPGKGKEQLYVLHNISSTPIVRHVKVKGNSSPDDPSLREYWEKRTTKTGKNYWAKGSKYEQVAKFQNWKCPVCGDNLFNGEAIETHHIIPVAKGGSDDPDNLMHLHKACHKQVHSKTKLKGLK